MKGSASLESAGDNAEGLHGNTVKNQFMVVGIGASAGGIQALKEFFEHVPAQSGIAYVVILHLSPDHDSQLAEVLQTVAAIPVQQVMEKTKLEPDHVYVVPPNRHLTMEEGYIVVTPNLYVEERRAPVDIFFRTLAESHGAQAICVILSGMGANGSMGLKRIKEKGGAAFVQNPREAEFNEMPRNSIATELVDEVLPVATIPAKIIEYKNNLGTVRISEEPEKRPEDQQQALREIFTQLRLRTGNDFSNYKRPTLLRRIERRINIRNLPNLTEYAAFIQDNPDESTALLKDLLISVTNFFRDQKAWDVIEESILPQLLKDKTEESQLRIWVAGCATGEEAYTIAMLCAEKTLGVLDAPKVQIFATDIDEAAIAHAREGLYSLNDAADVSPERLRRFFNKEGDSYRIRREIREMVMFAHHNFIKDPPFSHLDIITCRNVLIYLNHIAQERVIETFHFALEPGAFLFLSLSETVDSATDLYVPYNREQHIFQSRQVQARSYPVPESVPILRADQLKLLKPATEQDKKPRERITYGELHQRLLEEYASPSIVINEEHDIVHISEKAGRFLQISGGEPSQNLLRLIVPELRLELRSALFQVAEQQAAVKTRSLQVMLSDRLESIYIYVKPVLQQDDAGRGFILVLFEPATIDKQTAEPVYTTNEPATRHLEEELVRLKAQLRSTIEQYEFQSEELKASNEELQAMNEELRSAAEELETSKEELQSINEEMRTVNQELKVKIDETSLSSNNLQNLINSTDIGTIFLDRGLRVKMFTPAVGRIFNLISADYGRPLTDITHKLIYSGIEQDAELVLDNLQTIEREVRTHDNNVFLMRILPYRTSEDRINGVVVTFIDISQRKSAEEASQKSEERMRLFLTTSSDAIYTMNADWTELQDLKGNSFLQDTDNPNQVWVKKYIPDEDWPTVSAVIQNAIKTKKTFELEHRVIKADGTYGWTYSRAVPIVDYKNEITEWFGAATDITANKQAENALRESEERLQAAMDSAIDYAIITLSTSGIVEAWNTGASAIFGYTAEEIKGKSVSILFTPEDQAANTPEKEMQTATDKGRAEDERWHMRKDGSRFFASGVITPIHNGKLIGYVKVARDMTGKQIAEEALRLSEERYRTVIESANMGAWDWDIVKNKTIWNKEHYNMLGADLEHQPMDAAYFLHFLHPDDKERVTNTLIEAVNDKGTYQSEFRILRGDNGEMRWLSGYGRVAEVKDGQAVRMVGVMSDITERKAMEQQKDDFIGIASHELKTPVTSIKAYTQILQDTFEKTNDSKSAMLMQRLDAQVDRLTTLIGNLLDTTKIAEGQLPLHFETFDFKELIAERTEDLQRLSQAHKLNVHECENIIVTADRERIGQVLTNLLSNAIKYSPLEEEIIITCQATPDNLTVSVQDRGIGIPEDMQQKVFDRFFRVKDSQMQTFPGMGLGLYITAGIVQRHGGTISVTSKVGEGSLFSFILPLKANI